jgi:hypothetical protein
MQKVFVGQEIPVRSPTPLGNAGTTDHAVPPF